MLSPTRTDPATKTLDTPTSPDFERSLSHLFPPTAERREKRWRVRHRRRYDALRKINLRILPLTVSVLISSD